MPYVIYQFGTTVLPQYSAEANVGTMRMQSSIRELPGGGVWRAQGIQRSGRAPSTVTKRCSFAEDTDADMRTTYNELRALVGTVDRLWRVWDDADTPEWVWAEMREVDSTRQKGMVSHLEVDLEFAVLSPAWLGTHHAEAWSVTIPPQIIVGDGHTLGSGSTIALGPPAIPTVQVINNNGNTIVRDGVITITAGDAAITSVSVLVTSLAAASISEWLFSNNILAGQELVVDAGTWTVTNNGVDAYSGFTLASNHNHDGLLVLGPGANGAVITYAGGGVGSTFLCDFHDSWE